MTYINVDSSASGPEFHGGAVGSLAPEMLVEPVMSIEDPSGTYLHEAWKKTTASSAKRRKRLQRPRRTITWWMSALGAGQTTPCFLNFLAGPVVELQFDGPYGVYHSMYDDFYWMNHFGDPGYRYHAAMSQLWGTLALRLADADILPFDFAAYAGKVREFAREVQAKPEAAKNMDLAGVLKALDDFESEGKRLRDAAARRCRASSRTLSNWTR